jgi:hypothetical protein
MIIACIWTESVNTFGVKIISTNILNIYFVYFYFSVFLGGNIFDPINNVHILHINHFIHMTW